MACRLLDRALLHLGDVAGNGDDDARLHEPAGTDLPDEVADHRLGDVEVRDYAGLHRPDRDDVAGGAPEHALRLVADCQNALGAALYGNDGRLAQHDAPVLHIDQRVGRAEVDPDVVREEVADFAPHDLMRSLSERGMNSKSYPIDNA